MPNINTYPEREHLEPVCDFYDVLQYELSIHPNGPELRRGLDTISSIYKTFPLNRSMQQYSRLMAMSQAKMNNPEHEDSQDIDFYMGSVLAAHCILRSQTARKRGILLRNDIFQEYLTDNNRYHIPSEDLETMLGSLTIWNRGEFMNSLGGENEKFQELVITAASRTYDDVPNAADNEDSFISGFMIAKDMLVIKLIDINSRSYERGYIFPGPPV